MVEIQIPISVGELLDKISILSIKSQHTSNTYVHKELQDLIKIAQEHQVYNASYISQLLQVNRKLWKIEDDLRVLEKLQDFDATFIDLARSVYIINDERARIKKEINEKYKSTYKEVKCYV
jgi:translation initiation factor RLI1